MGFFDWLTGRRKKPEEEQRPQQQQQRQQPRVNVSLLQRAMNTGSRAYDTVNPFDGGRSWNQRTPTNNRSVVQQAGGMVRNRINSAPSLANPAGFVGAGGRLLQGVSSRIPNNPLPNSNPVTRLANQNIVQPYKLTSGNVGRLMQGRNPYKGNLKQQAGQLGQDAINVASVVPIGGAANLVMRGGRVLPRVVQGAKSGLKVGSGFGAAQGTADALKQEQNMPQAARTIATSTVVGGAVGGVTGGALPAAGAAARAAAPVVRKGAQRTAQAVQQADQRAFTPRVNVQDQNILRDYSDMVHGNYNPQGAELSNLIAQARQVGAKYGVNLANGSVEERRRAVNALLDRVGQSGRQVSQGGYIQLPGDASDDLVKKVFSRQSDAGALYHGTEAEGALGALRDQYIKANQSDIEPAVSFSRQRNAGIKLSPRLGKPVRLVADQTRVEQLTGKTKPYVDGELSRSKEPSMYEAEQRVTGKDVPISTLRRIEIDSSLLTPEEVSQIRVAAKSRGIQVIDVNNPDEIRGVIPIKRSDGPKPELPSKVIEQAGMEPLTKQRGFVSGVKQSTEVSGNTKRRTTGEYEVRNTQNLQNQAEDFATTDIKTARADLDKRLNVKDGNITDREVADTISFAKRLDAEGDFEGASTLYEKLAGHLTKLGQSVQAASLLSRRTPEGIQYQAQKSLSKAGIQLTPGKQAQFKQLIENVRRTAPESPERQRATYDVTKFVSDNTPSSTTDRVINFWRAGLLTAPTTTAGNILGNAGEAIVRKGFVNPVATAADAAMGLFTGKRTQTLAPIGSGVSGARQGASKLPDFIKTGYDERNAIAKYDGQATNYGNSAGGKLLAGYVNGVYRLMGTADQPFYYSAHKNALGSIARAEAINNRMPPRQRKEWIKNFMDNPPQEAIERAAQEAAYATFQNKTGLGKAAVAMKDGINKAVPGLGDFIIPFTQVPASIATRIITRTPVGTAAEVVRQMINVRRGGQFDQRAMAQAIGEGAFGAGALGVGYALANSGLLTFGYPKDLRERALWEQEGKQPYSVKVGNRWYSLNYLQPFGTILAIGGRVGQEIDGGKALPEALAIGVATAGESLSNQSFIKGISGAVEAITNPVENATKYVNQVGGSLVPNIVGATTRAFDPVQREQAGFVEGIMQDIPGLRDNTPVKEGAFGEPLPAKDNPANQLFNPLRPSIDRTGDPVLAETRRLQDAELGMIPSQIKKNTYGKDTELNKDQIRELQGNVGRAVNDAWAQLIETDEYKSLNDEEKSRALKSLSGDILAVEKRDYAAANQLGEYSPTSTKEPKALSSREQAIKDGTIDISTYAAPKESRDLPKNMNADNRTLLSKHNALTDEKKKKALYEQPDLEWKLAVAQYEADMAKGKLNAAAQIKRQSEIDKLLAGSKFSKDIRDLYSVSEARVDEFLRKDKNGQALAEQLMAYDQALYDAGLIKNLKYKNGINASSRKGGGKGGRGGKGKGLKLKPNRITALSIKKPATIRITRAPLKQFKVSTGAPAPRMAKIKAKL